MAWYRAKTRGYIPVAVEPAKRADLPEGRRVFRTVEEGETFEYGGKRGAWMEPVDGPGGAPGKSGGRRGPNATNKDESGQTAQTGSQVSGAPGAETGNALP